MDYLLLEKAKEATQAYSTQLPIIAPDGLFIKPKIVCDFLGSKSPSELRFEQLVLLGCHRFGPSTKKVPFVV